MPLPTRIRRRMVGRTAAAVFLLAPFLGTAAHPQPPRKVIIDQDASGPGGSDMLAILALVNSPRADVLGITVLTGNAWRDEEVLHALRLLEIIGRTDIPVVPGATFPLVSSREYIAKWETLYGKIAYQGAWNHAKGHAVHGPAEIPPMAEGAPTTKASSEDAPHFLVRLARQYPHQITIYAAGPMTDLALAIALEPHFAELTKELIVMGGSIHPQTNDPEFGLNPRREFNFWMDPEASRAVLHARWPRLVLTTVDISVKTYMEKSLIAQIAKSARPSAQYAARYAETGYLWDELAAVAWLDPSLITKWERLYVDVNVDHGAGYGDTLVWVPGQQPGLGEQLVEVQKDLDKGKFYREFVDLLTVPTPARTPERSGEPTYPGTHLHDQREIRSLHQCFLIFLGTTDLEFRPPERQLEPGGTVCCSGNAAVKSLKIAYAQRISEHSAIAGSRGRAAFAECCRATFFSSEHDCRCVSQSNIYGVRLVPPSLCHRGHPR